MHLPMPPSVNKYQGHLGSSHGIVRDWHKKADALLLTQGPKPPMLRGYVEISVVWDEKKHRTGRGRRDIDNPIKPLFDFLVSREYIEDDSFINSYVVTWGTAPEGALVQIVKFPVRLSDVQETSAAAE